MDIFFIVGPAIPESCNMYYPVNLMFSVTQSTSTQHEMHTVAGEHALKESPIYDFIAAFIGYLFLYFEFVHCLKKNQFVSTFFYLCKSIFHQIYDSKFLMENEVIRHTFCIYVRTIMKLECF